MSARTHEVQGGARRATSTNGSERGLVHEIRQRRAAQVASAPLSPAEHRRARVLRSTPVQQNSLSALDMRLLKVAIGVAAIGIVLIIGGMVYTYTSAAHPSADPYVARIQELQSERQALAVHRFAAPVRHALVLPAPTSSATGPVVIMGPSRADLAQGASAKLKQVPLPPKVPVIAHPARAVVDLIAPPKAFAVKAVRIAPARAAPPTRRFVEAKRAPRKLAVVAKASAAKTVTTIQSRPAVRPSPFGVVIYRAAPRAAVAAAAPAQAIRPAPAPVAAAARHASNTSLHGMQIVGFPSGALVLIASKVGGQTLVSPYQVGQSLPGGARITSIDAQGGRVITTAGALASTQ